MDRLQTADSSAVPPVASRSLRWMKAALIVLAAALMFLGITQELPYSYYGDEAHFVKRALAFGSGDLNPHWFNKPAFFMYLLFFEYGVYYVTGLVFGAWGSVNDFGAAYILDPGPFYLIGRCTAAVFGLLTLWVVWLIGERHLGRRSGWLAAGLLAVCYGLIIGAQRVKADVPATFFGTLSLYFVLCYARDRSWRSLLLAAGIAGVGAATKTYPLNNLAVLLAVAGWGLVREKFRRASITMFVMHVAGALALFWLAYFICAPYNFLDPQGLESTFGRFRALYDKVVSVVTGGQIVSDGELDGIVNESVPFHESVWRYLRVLVSWSSMGSLIGVLGLAGAVWALASRRASAFWVVGYGGLFVLISTFTYPGYASPRHQIPLLPCLTLCGAGFLLAVEARLGRWRSLAGVLFLGAMAAQVGFVATQSWKRLGEDTRTAAKAWIEERIPADSTILVDENGPPLLWNKKRLEDLLRTHEQTSALKSRAFTAELGQYLKLRFAAAKKGIAYDVHEIRKTWWRAEEGEGQRSLTNAEDQRMGNPLFPYGVKRLEEYRRDEGIEYVVVHAEKYERFLDPESSPSKRRPSFHRFYIDLFQRGVLLEEIRAEGGLVGPTVKIFDIRAIPAAPPESRPADDR